MYEVMPHQSCKIGCVIFANLVTYICQCQQTKTGICLIVHMLKVLLGKELIKSFGCETNKFYMKFIVCHTRNVIFVAQIHFLYITMVSIYNIVRILFAGGSP